MGVKLRNNIGAKSLDEFQPCQDYLVVEVMTTACTESGIVLAKTDTDTGEVSFNDRKVSIFPVGLVVKAGPGYFTDSGVFVNQQYEKGDVVYWRESSYAALQPEVVDINGEQIMMIRSVIVIGKVAKHALPPSHPLD